MSLGSEIAIGKDLTLTGAGPEVTFIQADITSGTATFRVFQVTKGNTVSMSGVTIRHGNPTNANGGGILNSGVSGVPRVLPGKAVILDPMLATGGSACLAVELLVDEGYAPESIYFTGVVAAREGFERLAEVIPRPNITVVAIDPELNDKKYIVPGLGDYGDRYYGT